VVTGLIDEEAVAAVRTKLLPPSDLITPNVPEAAAMLGTAPVTDALPEQALALLALGPGAVLLKGARGPVHHFAGIWPD
jgi:hydroxymethylpyrimidine/phosphomethylpyrimidine kinase